MKDDDFVRVQSIPQSKPKRYLVELWRHEHGSDDATVVQASEPMGRTEAETLCDRWADWHRVVRIPTPNIPYVRTSPC